MADFSEEEFDASAAAAKIAVNLLSAVRVLHKLDKKYTEYSAQYLLDYACPKKESGEGETDYDCSELTAKHCIEFVFKQGIPKGEDWPHLGSLVKPPTFYIPALVSMKGELIEPKDYDDALQFFYQQPIGARLHVFSPELDDHVDENGVYDGPSSDETRYVGLRDVMVVTVNKMVGETLVSTVRIYYNKKVTYVDVALDAMILGASSDESQVIKPGPLLVDYFLPRLSIN